MYERHELGKIGEEIVSKYLEKNNYKILLRNFRCKQGEIDIIAKEGQEYVFIEVKTRTNIFYGLPKEAVNGNKKSHIYRAVEYFVYMNKLENVSIRIDVIEVYKNEKKFIVNHIKHAITERPF